MYIQTDMSQNSSQAWIERDFDVEVFESEHGVMVEFRYDSTPMRGGRVCVSRTTARWLAYALLAVAERASGVQHLHGRAEGDKIVSGGPVQSTSP